MITHQSSLNDFTSQITFVLNTYKNHNLKVTDFSNVVLGGMGGSGIAGQIVKSWFFDKMPVPVETIADYNMPAYANNKTLVILYSYSGGTEETLNLFSEAKEKGCAIICIATGGKLAELAKENDLVL